MTIRRVFIADTETTGLPPGDQVIEVCAALYSLDTGLLSLASTLLPWQENPAEHINRIPVAALQEVEGLRSWGVTLSALGVMAYHADIAAAHRSEFDERHFASVGRLSSLLPEGMPWVCTKFDFLWPRQTRIGESLVPLCLEHGIGVASAHRAATDVLLIVSLLDRCREMGRDLHEMFEYAMRPKARFQALVSYDKRDLAKEAGFGWDPAKKRWWRSMAIDDATALGFPVRQLKEGE